MPTSAKKDTGAATREIDDIVLLEPFTDPDGFAWEVARDVGRAPVR